jgi:hypothetical protein
MKLRLPETEIEYRKALEDAAHVASVQALVSAGVLSPYMSLSECYRQHGEGVTDGWVKQGMIDKIKDGDGNRKVRISRVQVEAAARTDKRAAWYVRIEN